MTPVAMNEELLLDALENGPAVALAQVVAAYGVVVFGLCLDGVELADEAEHQGGWVFGAAALFGQGRLGLDEAPSGVDPAAEVSQSMALCHGLIGLVAVAHQRAARAAVELDGGLAGA